jgi:hypothetical protein
MMRQTQVIVAAEVDQLAAARDDQRARVCGTAFYGGANTPQLRALELR